MSPAAPPTLRLERQAWRSGAGVVAALDEVGRGALAGPVSVGVVLLAPDCKPAPYGVADSKLLTPAARVALVPRIRRWALESAVGHASAAEIDQVGIIAALRLAAERAIGQLTCEPDWILLDGNHDYLTRPAARTLFEDSPAEVDLRDAGYPRHAGHAPQHGPWECTVPVRTVIKGDMRCSSIAAASVLAKTERDAILVELARSYPEYGFDENKAYASPRHREALQRLGPCEQHRRSWNLLGRCVDGVDGGVTAAERDTPDDGQDGASDASPTPVVDGAVSGGTSVVDDGGMFVEEMAG